MSERIAISVSSSPVSQINVGIGGNDYSINSGRGDRPRISLLPSSASVALAPSPTTANEYHMTNSRNQRGLMSMQSPAEQYASRAIDISASMQEAPPFKKIRLGQQQQVGQSQQSPCQTISPADITIKQEHVQLPQPLRIDTRVGGVFNIYFILCSSR